MKRRQAQRLEFAALNIEKSEPKRGVLREKKGPRIGGISENASIKGGKGCAARTKRSACLRKGQGRIHC